MAVPDPLVTGLRPGPPALARAIVASLAQSLGPAEDTALVPPWLLPEQGRSFRRVVAAVRRHGGAVLADPVGSGKTYIALAAALAFNRGPTACLIPAALLHQWETAAARVGADVRLGSHEQVSRGSLPQGTRGLVLIDESHHFRNRHTRRYNRLAPWLVGRQALLITATPVVNHLSDLAHQLLLAVRDDALAPDGVVSIGSLLASGRSTQALGRLVIESETVSPDRPRKVLKTSPPSAAECDAAGGCVEALRGLRLSSHEPVAALIRGALLRAASSSPAALAGALQRYRRLLRHARDALEAGRMMDRSELRRFMAELGDQLVWWELFSSSSGCSDLELADLRELDTHIHAATTATQQVDTKLERLAELLGDAKPTIVFTTSRDTVRYLRARLCDRPIAWCTGDRAGIGPMSLPRRTVLGWFREGTVPASAPRHLMVTDVAAEGLDLQRAARVVHYDLPWTPMRLEQREGRALRLGSRHSEVEVVRFTPPPVLERTLRLEATLARKMSLPAAAGLGTDGRHIWRWRAELAGLFNGVDPVAGVAQVASPAPGVLAGFALYRTNDPTALLSASVGWLEPGGAWIETPETVAERLIGAAQSRSLPVDSELLRQCLALLAQPIRDRLGLARGRHWVSPDPGPAARLAAGRLSHLIGDAARRRQAARLLRLERALGFVAGGHTAGEEMLIQRLAEDSDAKLEAELDRLATAQPAGDGMEVKLTGMIVFSPCASALPT